MRKIVALLLAMTLAGCSQKTTTTNGAKQERPPATVSAEPARLGTLREFLGMTGHLRATDRAEVTSKINGRVDRVLVREGDRVQAGEPLIVLDSRDLSAQVHQADAQVRVARANLQQSITSSGMTDTEVSVGVNNAKEQVNQAKAAESRARVDLEDARLNLEREKSLFAQDAVPKIQVEQAELRYKLAQRTLQSATAQVEIAEEGVRLAQATRARRQMSQDQVEGAAASVQQAEAGRQVAVVMHDYSVLSSPISGVVTRRNVEPGEMVGPGESEPLLLVVDNSQLELMTTASEQYAPDLKPGMTLEIRSDLYAGKKFTGRIKQVIPSANPGTHTVSVRVEVNDRGYRLFDGLFVEASMKVRDHQGVVIPRLAVQRRQKETYVMLLVNGQARKTPVEIVYETDTEAVVNEGVKAGDQVITAGAEGLSDGQKVQLAGGKKP